MVHPAAAPGVARVLVTLLIEDVPSVVGRAASVARRAQRADDDLLILVGIGGRVVVVRSRCNRLHGPLLFDDVIVVTSLDAVAEPEARATR